MNSSDFRNSLVNAATPAEIRLLQLLDADPRFTGRVEFQKQIGRFYVDFYISDKKLAIELDGSSHISKTKYDSDRTVEIKKYGITVIRFQNSQVFKTPGVVISKIFNYTSNSKRKNKHSFIANHINKECFKDNKKVKKIVSKGLQVIRRKKNPAVGSLGVNTTV
jgi:very-short-patch-repair endonuclease